MVSISALLLIVGLVIPPGGIWQRQAHGVLWAQDFKVPPGEGSKPAPGTQPKQKPKPKAVKPGAPATEDDLFKEQAADEKGKGKGKGKEKNKDVEEINPDEVPNTSEEGTEGQEDTSKKPKKPDEEGGGWGGKVERDRWGDEDALNKANKKLPGEDEGVPAVGEQPRPGDGGVAAAGKPGQPLPDGGLAAGQAEPRAADGGLAVAPDGGAELPSHPAPGAPGEEQVAIRPPSGTVADLGSIAEKRRLHLNQRDFALAKQDLENFIQLQDELGIPNAALQANVLLREAKQAREREDRANTEELLDAAVRLAPDLPATHLAQASFWFAQSPFKVGRVAGALLDAGQATLKDPLAVNRLLVNLAIGLLLGLGLAGGIFLVVQFLRTVGLFFHDFHHLFPRGVARLQTMLLALLLVLTPFLFRAGPLVVLLTWSAAAWLYLSRAEKVIGTLVILFFGFCPFAVKWLVEEMIFPDSLAGDIAAVERDVGSSDSITHLKIALEGHPDNAVVLAALGGYSKRTGDLAQAQALYQRALQVKPDSEVLANNLGNVMFLQNDLDRALELYNRSTQLRPGQVVPYFNLSKLYYRKLDLNKGNQSHQEAMRLDAEAVRRLAGRAATGMANHAVADLPIPQEWIASLSDGTVSEEVRREMEGQVWKAVGGSGAVGNFPFVAGGVVILLLLLQLLQGKLYLSRGCVRCGRPACRRCNNELKDDTFCGQCFHAFLHKEQVDAKSRISKEIEIRQFRRRRESIARGITFLLPGTGQLLKGRPVRGALILAVCCSVLVEVLTGEGVMRSPMTLGTGANWLKLVPLLVLFLGFYAWAILDAFRAEE